MKPDGGPAFPTPLRFLEPGEVQVCDRGMTLRDYFAAAALTRFASHRVEVEQRSLPLPPRTEWQPDLIAQWCYQVADAMLAERDK